MRPRSFCAHGVLQGCSYGGRDILRATPRQIVSGLQVDPELRCGLESLGQQPSGFRRDSSFAADQLVDPLDRDPKMRSQPDLGYLQRVEELLQEHFAWMSGDAVFWDHMHLSVIVDQPNIVRVATHPPEDQPPLVVDPYAVQSFQVAVESLQTVARGRP